ncbi:YeaC family protein [Simiduia sp. 21SJ11W-1]|uniref:YeaC family protein n=1 Tax=Simiduia sp. 21SJ11W-1 TaxID=2909669 RepID=UPI00209D78DD|nr:YeaC family protein [Simiduia sp. 21SJ11W-1]UTA49348.1 YeaC family protein [Simiduia sp. 21SJ11W-1]
MDYKTLLDNLTPEVYENLKRAIELGKWPDGRALTQEQRATCMQAVIAYEHKHLPPEQHTGFIPPKPHQHCGEPGDDEQPVTWKH